MKFNPRIKGIILVIIGSMLWGISGTFAQFLFQKEGFTPEWLVVIRLLTSGIVLCSYTFFKNRHKLLTIWKSKYSAFSLLFFGIIGMVGVQYSYFATIKYGNAATATILQYLSPVIVTCYLAILSKKLPSYKEIGAVALAMFGTFLIITKGNLHTISISKLALFWGIISAFAAAFYTLQPRKLLIKWDATIVAGWGMLIGGVAFSFIHAPWNFTGSLNIYSISSVIFVVLFGTIIGFYCYLESLKYIKPTDASILSSVEPLSAAFLSMLFLNVHFSITQWLGSACIIFTVIILSFTKPK